MEAKPVDTCFIPFRKRVDHIPLPKEFTFPFYYDVHPLSEIATKQLQEHLTNQKDWTHNFGLDASMSGLIIGKMFGVLVVKNREGQLGFLSAFSGKLADKNHLPGFVPPIFDMLTVGSFFKKGSDKIAALTHQIETLETAKAFSTLKDEKELAITDMQTALSLKRQNNKAKKKLRKEKRETTEVTEEMHRQLILESQYDNIALVHLKEEWKQKVALTEKAYSDYTDQIELLKTARKEISKDLQQKLFASYKFLNIKGEVKTLNDLFIDKLPIAGTGECAAPKLLQYAFANNYKPIAMAEFWWGEPPKSQVRKHQQYYPACRGKCKPVLTHMLEHMKVADNPMLKLPDPETQIKTIFEDAHMLVIHKPHELLSVPGIAITDSVATRMKEQFPEATGPMVVHRLDMSTSGLMLIAKTEKAHKYLQQQFIHRTIKKKYIALLDGYLTSNEGLIDLPLRVDLDDRPRQLVCYEHGKPAQTKYEIIERTKKMTRIAFFPITGRTHQLRVHAAHTLGLGLPIVGDDLYGRKGERLFLHAAAITFVHPERREEMFIELPPAF